MLWGCDRLGTSRVWRFSHLLGIRLSRSSSSSSATNCSSFFSSYSEVDQEPETSSMPIDFRVREVLCCYGFPCRMLHGVRRFSLWKNWPSHLEIPQAQDTKVSSYFSNKPKMMLHFISPTK